MKCSIVGMLAENNIWWFCMIEIGVLCSLADADRLLFARLRDQVVETLYRSKHV